MNVPTVAILIAVRNEEACIATCLQALARLDYPAGLWEVWLGDDDSEDNSATIIKNFCTQHPHFRLLEMAETAPSSSNGKARVLSQLVPHTQAEFLFFTDADTIVPPTWLKTQVAHFQPSIGIIAGWTLPQGDSWLARLQMLEWLRVWQIIQWLSDWQIPSTVMGNNLIISRLAYEKTGGFARLPFSLTEDLAIFRAVLKQGFSFKIISHRHNLAFTQAPDTWQSLIAQRQRWMAGIKQFLPWYGQIFLLGQALWLPICLVLAIWLPWLALSLFLGEFFLSTSLIIRGLQKINQIYLVKYLPFWLGYQLGLGLWSVFLYGLVKPVKWKGRIYN
jgi:cellulose synthase/poly-beta-1,6-N-acetylglucosamine synthase-like glycosyltransferase